MNKQVAIHWWHSAYRQPSWSHPVIANGKLYIRDQDTLFCYDLKAK